MFTRIVSFNWKYRIYISVYFVHLLYLLFKKYNNSLMIIYIIYRLMIKISYDKNF